MAVFNNIPGDNTFSGTDTEYDQVDYAGSLTDYTFVRNDDGTVTVTHPTLGTDTLSSIEGFWFAGEAQWYSLDQAIELTNGNMDPVVFGTNGNDLLVGSAINNTFIGSSGNDIINGNGGDYNQIDYEGSITDYTFEMNIGGTVSVVHPVFGRDSIRDIDGFWFTGEQAWYSLADALQISPPNEDDFAANASTTGSIIADGEAATGNIETRGDNDWFAIDGEAGQTIRFSLDAASSLIGLRIFDADGNQLDSSVIVSPTGAPGNGDVFFTIPDDGDYFVAAAGLSFRTGTGLGEYSISAETVTDDFGDTIADAALIDIDGTIINGAINEPDDVDVFAINVEAGQMLDISLEGDFFGWAQLLDVDGNVLQNPFGNEIYDVIEDGTLYVRVQSLGGSPYTLEDDWGDYTLSVTDTSNDPIMGTEGDDTLTGTDNADAIFGLGGNDIINGGTGFDFIRGGDGNDVIRGEEGNDLLNGDLGDDQIFGGDGNDQITGGDGIDSLRGNAGADRLSGDEGNDFLDGGTGTDELDGGSGDDRILGGSGDDRIFGGDGDDTILGEFFDLDNFSAESENDFISGGAGSDSIQGQRGDDLIDGGSGNDFLSGGADNDTILGGTGNDFISGGSGQDILTGGTGADEFQFRQQPDVFVNEDQITDFNSGEGDTIDISSYGLANFAELQSLMTQTGDGVRIDFADGSNLTLQNIDLASLTGADFGFEDAPINGTQGDDDLSGTTGDDIINGLGGNDFIRGFSGNDTLNGGAGNDVIQGANGDDMLAGGSGADRLFGGFGADTIFGGDGDDLIYGEVIELDGFPEGVAANDTISGGNGNDTILGQRGDDTLNGGAGDDSLSGGFGDDTLNGGADNDLLIGSLGNDRLNGGAGDDVLNGDGAGQFTASGDDVLIGGTGADTFILTQAGEGTVSNVDRITDFNSAEGDSIDVDDFGIADFGALQSMMSQANNNVRIDFVDGSVVLINNTQLADLTAADFGLEEAPSFIEGTDGNDVLTGSNIDNVFFGGTGDDIIDGNGGDYNQADYNGSISDYAIFANGDGSYTVSHAEGTDTLTDIDGFWFGGDAQWYSLDDAINATANDVLI